MGRALLEMTRKQHATEVEMEQLLSSSRGMLSGHLRIAADSPFLIMPLVKDFASQHPSIKVAIDFGNTQWVSQQLIEGPKYNYKPSSSGLRLAMASWLRCQFCHGVGGFAITGSHTGPVFWPRLCSTAVASTSNSS